MEESSAKVARGLSCPACRKDVEPDDAFCNNCGYPRKGSEQERRVFLLKRKTKNKKLDAANKGIRQATNTLFIVGGLNILFSWGVYAWGLAGRYQGDRPRLISDQILGVIFVALGFWYIKRPLAAILAGASWYLLLQIFYLITSPGAFLRIIVYRLFVMGYLIVGLRSVIKADRLKKKLNT